MSNNVNAYTTITTSLEPATYDVPAIIPESSTELSPAGLPPGSHRFIVGQNANPAALADAVAGNNPRLRGAQAHYMANAAKNYGALKPGMIVEFKPSEQIIGHQGPASLQRAAKAYEALKQLERETGTTRLNARDQARIDAEMRAIRGAATQVSRPQPCQLTSATPMQHEDTVVAASPLRAAKSAAPATTRAALVAPRARIGTLGLSKRQARSSTLAANNVLAARAAPAFEVTAPTLLAAR